MNTTQSPPPSNASKINPHGRGRVLVVDDEPVLRAMATTVLRAEGWDVINASSAEEAIELLKFCASSHARVEVVILDLILPGGMSGMEAVGALRAIQPGLRMVANSGFFATDDPRGMCLSMGFDDVLHKPYSVALLAETVERNAWAATGKTGADPAAWEASTGATRRAA